MNDSIYNYTIYLPFLHNPFYKCVFDDKEAPTNQNRRFPESFPEFSTHELPDEFNESLDKFPIFNTLNSNLQTYIREA